VGGREKEKDGLPPGGGFFPTKIFAKKGTFRNLSGRKAAKKTKPRRGARCKEETRKRTTTSPWQGILSKGPAATSNKKRGKSPGKCEGRLQKKRNR